MWRLIRGLFYLLVIGVIGLAGYAYLGDLTPPQRDVALPVVLDVE